MRLKTRGFHSDDSAACYYVFCNAVHEGTTAHYSAAERAAWAPEKSVPDNWQDHLSQQMTFVATARGKVVGFMTLGRDGHIDFAYVAPSFMGQGVGDTLYNTVLDKGRSLGFASLQTEASYLARRFFKRHGWKTKARQSVIRDSVPITNFRMRLVL